MTSEPEGSEKKNEIRQTCVTLDDEETYSKSGSISKTKENKHRVRSIEEGTHRGHTLTLVLAAFPCRFLVGT
jgi:hypothetical protein